MIDAYVAAGFVDRAQRNAVAIAHDPEALIDMLGARPAGGVL
jgi:hypothetical protein